MLSISQIKLIKSLEHKKFRQEHNIFVAEGIKIVEELLLSDYEIEEIYMTNNISLNIPTNVNHSIISQKELNRISFLKTPNKILALVKIPTYSLDIKNFNKELILALDNINDPGNMGTIIRIANWYGISIILCNNNCVDCYNPKVIQSAMGAIFRTKLIYSDLQEIINKIKSSENIPIYAANLNGTSLYNTSTSDYGIIVIGNEAHGISHAISSLADYKIKIPSFPAENPIMESLNAGVATGIICAEFRKNTLELI